MRVAVMQPYVFPYVGYYQLVANVDVLVFLDDAAFIKRGWINRNRILVNGREHLFTIPLRDVSQNRTIAQHSIIDGWSDGFLKTLKHAYVRAPMFDETYRLVDGIVQRQHKDIASLAMHSVTCVASHVGLRTTFDVSSKFQNAGLRGQERVIDICRALHATTYVNLPGGVSLYNADVFLQHGIALEFIPTLRLTYEQFDNEFVPNLSIIDALMFNDRETIKNHLKLL